MSTAKPAAPTSADLPLDPIPVQDVGHHAAPAIDPAVDEALRDYVARRRRGEDTAQ